MLPKDVNSDVILQQLTSSPVSSHLTSPKQGSSELATYSDGSVLSAYRVCEPRDDSYKTRAQFERWLREIPVEFPRCLDDSKALPPVFNALVGNEYKDTCENVANILEMLRNLALPSYTEKADFSLSEQGTLGFVSVLECMTAALRFEREYRNKGDYGTDPV